MLPQQDHWGVVIATITENVARIAHALQGFGLASPSGPNPRLELYGFEPGAARARQRRIVTDRQRVHRRGARRRQRRGDMQ